MRIARVHGCSWQTCVRDPWVRPCRISPRPSPVNWPRETSPRPHPNGTSCRSAAACSSWTPAKDAAMSWSAKQYVAFEDERTRPVRDLLSALPDIEVRSAVDLGCGPGNSTETLAARFPDAAILGLDSSPDMIAAARLRLPQLRFTIGGIEEWLVAGRGGAGGGDAGGGDAGPFDVILANAVLQWVPDHARLLPALVGRLSGGGVLAIQMPDNLEEPAHRLMREIAADGAWANTLAEAAQNRTAIASADGYYELLRPSSSRVEVWRTTYYHALPGGAAAIVE